MCAGIRNCLSHCNAKYAIKIRSTKVLSTSQVDYCMRKKFKGESSVDFVDNLADTKFSSKIRLQYSVL